MTPFLALFPLLLSFLGLPLPSGFPCPLTFSSSFLEDSFLIFFFNPSFVFLITFQPHVSFSSSCSFFFLIYTFFLSLPLSVFSSSSFFFRVSLSLLVFPVPSPPRPSPPPSPLGFPQRTTPLEIYERTTRSRTEYTQQHKEESQGA